MLKSIAKGTSMIGQAEELLYPAERVESEIGIVLPPANHWLLISSVLDLSLRARARVCCFTCCSSLLSRSAGISAFIIPVGRVGRQASAWYHGLHEFPHDCRTRYVLPNLRQHSHSHFTY